MPRTRKGAGMGRGAEGHGAGNRGGNPPDGYRHGSHNSGRKARKSGRK